MSFAGAPITWASKIQTITAMSMTEAEYIALSTSLRKVIPMMGMLQEAREHGLQVDYLPPKVHCTVFEDNSGALELARLPKIRPRTKHINQSYHHFRSTWSARMCPYKPHQRSPNWLTYLPSHSLNLLSRAIEKPSWDGRTLSQRMEGSVQIHAKSV